MDMDNTDIEKRLKRAFRSTLVCAIALMVGGGWVWIILRQGGPEALGAIIPMMAVGAIHLVGGPIAIFNAYKTYRHKRNLYIYFYFLVYIVLAFVIAGPEIMVYVSAFAIFTIFPIVLSGILAWAKHR